MASAAPVPMVTDKGKGPVLTAEVPWSEKYRPKTLDEVAAHKDIIDTSKWLCNALFGFKNCVYCRVFHIRS